MKMLDKNDIVFVNGHLVDPDGNIVNLPSLADEFNEVVEMAEFIEFVDANESAILNQTEAVVYTPTKHNERPVIKSGKTMATPLMDADKAVKVALAEEFLGTQLFRDVDNHLARYRNLAIWFANDNIIYGGDRASGHLAKFNDDILEWDEGNIVATVERWYDADFTKLRNQVKINFS